ncbi:MAG: hypothetical protein IPK66_03400 [Rhodospirillales bacterium]|nr:hypothetical protein [Rhodospirillales bacterium]
MKNRKPHKPAVLTVTIPEPLRGKVEAFLGSDIINDPAFWTIALRTGVEELERQFREIEAETEQEAQQEGYTMIFGSSVVIEPDDPDDDLPF